jgi:phosphatidate cytidylyltransferase
MSDNDAPDDRRTEGVRIIGAQEAAEAAGRPDVVRRRRRSEKRYGDRPDAPEPASDLPKITISTTEGDGGDLYGDPVAQPDPGAGAEQWSSGYGAYDDPERAGYGHARIVGDDPEDSADAAAPSASGDWSTPTAAASEPEWDDPYEPPRWSDDEPLATTGSYDAPAGASSGADPYGADTHSADPYGADAASSPTAGPAAGSDEPFLADDLDDPVAGDDDDSFVLPHWTEPPTGQVPKVVIGDNAPEPESLASYGSQPRWRDEGERTSVTDFDDLVDDGPALGALGNDSVEDDFFADDPFENDGFVDDRFVDEADEPYDEFGDEAEGAAAPTRRPARPRAEREPAERGGGGDRPLGVAVAVGVGLVLVGLVCFRLGALPTTLLATVVVTMAAFEYFTAVRERGNNPATLLGIVAVAGTMLAAATAGLAAYPVVIGLTVVFGLLWYLWVAPGERAVANLGLTLLGVLWIGFLGSFASLFLGLGRVLEEASPAITTNPGIGVLIAAVIAAVSHDVGAYFVGKYLGRTPLSAASPNKTQEGLIGGVLSSLVVTFVIVGLIGISPVGDRIGQAFIFALLCALVAPLGDLCESFIKRDLGIKDMGSVLPGHGGVLDRFDALLFVLPVAYFVTVLFDTWSTVGA